MTMLLLIAVFTATLGLTLIFARGGRPDPARQRLQALAAGLAIPSSPAPAPLPEPAGAIAVPARRGRAVGLQLALLRAGVKLRPAEYWATSFLAAALLGVVGWGMSGQVAGAVFSALTGLLLPPAALKRLTAVRVGQFEGQMADALRLIASSLRSGYSFLRALQVVGQEMPDPIAEEFRRVVAESSLGAPAEQTLGRMVERVPSYDLELVVTAVNIQLQVGGNLADILDTIAETIRERVRNQREIAALTAEGRISALVLGALPPVMGVILWRLNPVYMKPLFTTPAGLAMLVGAALLQLCGMIWMRALLKVDV